MICHFRLASNKDNLALADIVIDSTLTTFRGLVPDQCLDWLTKAESATNWLKWFDAEKPNVFLLVAEDENKRVVGCILGGRQNDPDFDGEIFLMGVLPDYQRQGIGHQLVRAMFDTLIPLGISRIGVRVMSVNPNRRFYEQLGAVFLREAPYDWNGVILPQSMYCWHL